MAREDLHFRLRIPAAEKEWVAQQAARNLRSMTAEINIIIRDAKLRAEFRGDAATGVGLGNRAPAAACDTSARQGADIHQRP